MLVLFLLHLLFLLVPEQVEQFPLSNSLVATLLLVLLLPDLGEDLSLGLRVEFYFV